MKNKITRFGFLALGLIFLISAWYIWEVSRGRQVDLDIEIPDPVERGIPLDLKVNFLNDSGAIFQDVQLTLALPEGMTLVGSPTSKLVEVRSLGNVGDGSSIQEIYRVIVLGNAPENLEIKASLNYSPASLRARFEERTSKNIVVANSDLKVEILAPESVLNGEEFNLEVSYQNQSVVDFSNLELQLEYPPSFHFVKSSLKPDQDNNQWLLGDLRRGSEGKFKISGSLIGVEGQSFDFKSRLAIQALGQKYIIQESSFKVLISASPLLLSLRLNNQNEDYTVKAGEELLYTISYVNGTDVSLRDVIIRVQLVGEMYDFGSLETLGSFRSVDNTIIWNSQNTPSLANLSSGSAGAVTFKIKARETYPIRRFSDRNFTLVVNAEAESVSKEMSSGKIRSKNRLESKVGGLLLVEARGYFRDAESGILNRGPLPPRVGQSTNFTIHWLLGAKANDFSNIEMRAALGDNVKMTGEVKSEIGSLPVYDPASNSVVWRIDQLRANQGVIDGELEAVFQLEAVPPKESAGQYLTLIQETRISGRDEFTGKEFQFSDGAITTALPDDITVGSQGGVVQP